MRITTGTVMEACRFANFTIWPDLAGQTNFTGTIQTVTVIQSLSASPRFYRLMVRLQ